MKYDLCVAISKDGRLKWISSLAAPVVARGATEDEFLGTLVWDRVTEPHIVRDAFMEVVATGEPRTVRTLTSDGQWHVAFHRYDEVVLALVSSLIPAPTLTVTEAAILALMAVDQTTKMISSSLKTSTSAVNTHTSTMRRKFGVRTNWGMVLSARDAGLI